MNTHPINRFYHCPECGQPELLSDQLKKVTCKKCKFSFYFNASAAVGAAILNKNNELLLTQRGKEPQAGLYDLPGGFVDINETAEEALIREIKEELGLEVVELSYLMSSPNHYFYKGISYFPLDLFFLCKVQDFSNLTAQDDVADTLWIHPNKIDPKQIAFESVRRTIQLIKDHVKPS